MPSIAADGVVHVAAGILTDRDKIFLTRRRSDVHQAGKWEFPGGKVDAGESVFEALRRELREELGIEVGDARPFMQIHHAYPDKQVCLNVWTVLTHSGVPHGREGQEARWVTRDELLLLDMPSADRPIQRRLWLPPLYAISDYVGHGRERFMQKLERALDSGLKLLQLREPAMAQTDYVALALEITALCHNRGAKVLLNADPALVIACGADGVHLNGERLRRFKQRPLADRYYVAASCHDQTQLKQAANIGADLVVLGPVATTPTHPGAVPLGWENFAALCREATLVVYALGGVKPTDIERARESGAFGVSMISGIWNASDTDIALASSR